MTTPAAVFELVRVTSSGSAPAFCASFAKPKSRILMRPSFVMKTFSGFRSRWTIPFSCAAANPCAICTPYSIVLRWAVLHGRTRRADFHPREAQRPEMASHCAARYQTAREYWDGLAQPLPVLPARTGASGRSPERKTREVSLRPHRARGVYPLRDRLHPCRPRLAAQGFRKVRVSCRR